MIKMVERMPVRVLNGALVALFLALVSGLGWLFSVRESVAVQAKDIDSLKQYYEFRMTSIQAQLTRIEAKVDSINMRTGYGRIITDEPKGAN